MRVLGLAWVGTRTDRFEETVGFFRDVLGLPQVPTDGQFAVLRVADTATVEVFGADSSFNTHLTSPVVGFLVDDLEGADEELRQAGVEIVLPLTRGDTEAWLHFRAPDGFLYELTQKW